MRRFDAVVFDFGGVIITPITDKIGLLADRHGVTATELLEIVMGPRFESTPGHPWHRLERGEIAAADLHSLVAPIASQSGIALAEADVDLILEASYRFHRGMLERIARLRADGYRTALLTNSVKEYRPTLEAELDLGLFDVVVDSSEVGIRKPEPAIYAETTTRLGVDPQRIVYLDDFEHNLDAATDAGWTVIHVTDPDEALEALDALLDEEPGPEAGLPLHWRRPVVNYQDLLDQDTRPVPAILRLRNNVVSGTEDIPVSRYTSRDWHEREVAGLWSRVWQFACREEHIPEPGDHVLYEIATRSFILVRQPDRSIRAFVNACLHRGRRLKDHDGHCSEIRCPFHGFAWALDGALADVPARWDFPQVRDEDFHLPEARVGTWAGFVFINPDPRAQPFEEFISGLAAHFERWDLGSAFVEAHVAKVIRANWKVAQEAFCEAYHVSGTHPQVLPWLGDVITQVDTWDNFARAITPGGIPSPSLSWTPSEAEMLRSMLDLRVGEALPFAYPEGRRMRAVAADLARERWRPIAGDQVDELCDAEMMDSLDYTLFPNFHPWGAYNRIVYRFRPNGDDHRSCIMEVLFLSPFNGDRPQPAPVRWLAEDEPWSSAGELAMLGKVFDQDNFNMPNVQRGLEATVRPGVTLSEYQEGKVRWLHQKLTEWVGEDG